jgi:hypothetical protein
VALLTASALHAQVSLRPPVPLVPPPAQPDPLHQTGQNVTISLLTMGHGNEVWELFGHTAIWIHDDVTHRDTVFNWGEFDQHAPHFILHFVQGLLLYRMGGQTLGDLMYVYQYLNRSVVQQELDLTDAQKDTLLQLIRVNAEPQNLEYRYDYFVDNCATRPRDLLDRALGGQLRIGADSLTPRSYRWHTLRLMRNDKPLVLGVDIGLGRPSDVPITRWQEMFLPKELHDWVATRTIRDSSGAVRPLVKRERVLFQPRRAPEPTSPPPLGRWLWPIGIVIGLLFGWACGERARRTARVTAAVMTAAVMTGVWAAVCGILGVVLAYLWFGTDHRFAHSNENLLLFNPLWLALAVLLPMYVVRDRFRRVTMWLLSATAVLALLALVIHAGLSRQDNLPLVGLALPAAIAMRHALFRGGPAA